MRLFLPLKQSHLIRSEVFCPIPHKVEVTIR